MCVRGADLFPHREDSPCLIREERLRVRQGDRQTGRERKNKKTVALEGGLRMHEGVHPDKFLFHYHNEQEGYGE